MPLFHWLFHSSLMQVVPTVDTILPTARTTALSTILVLNHSPLSKMTIANTQSVYTSPLTSKICIIPATTKVNVTTSKIQLTILSSPKIYELHCSLSTILPFHYDSSLLFLGDCALRMRRSDSCTIGDPQHVYRPQKKSTR
ncbi:hypothetical protein ARMGADRAFT_551988 [Armillaria gallica]|uniref:Uncharacterized protein n=1 Tax=Armillaria gallica TaxID=47427 RepID=A0A2H3DBU3_ARMGA|nr:hypothetical protein ARMGADRAFT_551988 [Armillaria gallica]